MAVQQVGESQPYVAANGHTMIAPIKARLVERDGEVQEVARFTVSAEAWCADGCQACSAGEPLPDW